jgi:hypothetical protein
MAVPIVHQDKCLGVLVFFGHVSTFGTHEDIDSYARFCNGLILSGLFQQEVCVNTFIILLFIFLGIEYFIHSLSTLILIIFRLEFSPLLLEFHLKK